MGAQHTPGPWFVWGPFIGPRLAPDSGIHVKVARIAGHETDADAVANARLIAAAPELLEALAEARIAVAADLEDAQSDEGRFQSFEQVFAERLARVDAAIAKATGAA